jgi:hypothetical protein
MVIYLPSQSVDSEPILDELTPREIVRELDKHVVGQADANAPWRLRCATASAVRSSHPRWPKR